MDKTGWLSRVCRPEASTKPSHVSTVITQQRYTVEASVLKSANIYSPTQQNNYSRLFASGTVTLILESWA